MTKALLLCLLLFPAAALAQPAPSSLTAVLAAALDAFPARTAVYVKHLKTGEEAAIRADESFNSQSVIKIPVMVRAYQLAEAGSLDLDERVTLTRADLRDGTGLLQYADLGLSPTLRDLIQHMIVTSDNTATDHLITRVGGVEAINTWLAASGSKLQMINRGYEYRRKLLARLDPRLSAATAEETTGLQYAMTENPLFEHYRPLFAGARAEWVDAVRRADNRQRHVANQRRLMVEDRQFWLGDITAREIGRMLEQIERDTAASPASCREMRTFLRRQLAGSRRLPHYLEVPVGHKTGDSGNIANDVGIIYAASGPIVMSVLVTGITGPYGEAEDRIGALARTVVAHFDRGQATVSGPPPSAPPQKRAIQPANYKPTPSPLSPAILAGDTLYLSGSTGGDPVSGQLVPGGFEPEMRQIMANVQTVLREAGMTLADVVKVTAYLADINDFALFNRLYLEHFTGSPLPARSTVAVSALARGARIELTLTAVRSR